MDESRTVGEYTHLPTVDDIQQLKTIVKRLLEVSALSQCTLYALPFALWERSNSAARVSSVV